MKIIVPVLLILATSITFLSAQREVVQFSVKSVADGDWTDPKTWQPQRIPKAGDRVLIHSGISVRFDAKTTPVIRLIQVAGALRFARDRSTELNVCLLKVQAGNRCTERGFACDFLGVNLKGEPNALPDESLPTLEVGT